MAKNYCDFMDEEWFQALTYSCSECTFKCLADCQQLFQKYGNHQQISKEICFQNGMEYLIKYMDGEKQYNFISICNSCVKEEKGDEKMEEEEKEEWDQKYNCICYINSNCCEHFARISQKERNKKREEGVKNNI